jgi:hypothetical protein
MYMMKIDIREPYEHQAKWPKTFDDRLSLSKFVGNIEKPGYFHGFIAPQMTLLRECTSALSTLPVVNFKLDTSGDDVVDGVQRFASTRPCCVQEMGEYNEAVNQKCHPPFNSTRLFQKFPKDKENPQGGCDLHACKDLVRRYFRDWVETGNTKKKPYLYLPCGRMTSIV